MAGDVMLRRLARDLVRMAVLAIAFSAAFIVLSLIVHGRVNW
jgi:hypothetical protein